MFFFLFELLTIIFIRYALCYKNNIAYEHYDYLGIKFVSKNNIKIIDNNNYYY